METDTPARITLAQAREAIASLPGHPVFGYDWDCEGCVERLRRPLDKLTGKQWWEQGTKPECVHLREDDAPISRLDVLAILDRVGP